MIILGLDISTSITGVTLIDEEENILLCEAWTQETRINSQPSFTRQDS